MGDPTDISKLLRMKGESTAPPPGYVEDFLAEFQRRQRAELLHRPLLVIMWDRLTSMAPNFHVPQLAYAAVVLVGIGVSALLITQGSNDPALIAAAPSHPAGPVSMSLNSSKPVIVGGTLPVRASGSMPAQYVLPSGSVSYDQPLSF